jgi:hypothetical protein
MTSLAPGEGRMFLERAFLAQRLPGEGVLTAYFAPGLSGAERRRTPNSAPRCGRSQPTWRWPAGGECCG